MWPDGRQYEGAFQEGIMHGLGVFIDKHGHRFNGHFTSGSGPGLTYDLSADGRTPNSIPAHTLPAEALSAAMSQLAVS
jgi:hypothetical protein